MRYSVLLLAVLFACSFTSCKIIDKSEVPEPLPAPEGTVDMVKALRDDAGKTSKALHDSSTRLHRSAKDIDKAAVDISKKDRDGKVESEVTTIRTEAGKVVTEAEYIMKLSLILGEARAELHQTKEQVSQLEKVVKNRDTIISGKDSIIEKKEAQMQELEEKHKKALQRMLMYAIMAGLAMVAVSAMLVVNGNGKAIGVGVAGAVLSLSALAVSFFMANLALIGAIGAVVIVGFVGYKIWEQKRDKQAQYELVRTTELIKKDLDTEDKVNLFGDVVGDGEVGALQSDATKAIVRANRARLAEEVKPAID